LSLNAAYHAANGSLVMIGQQVAQYQILAKLGAGGMGVVYLAQDSRLGRRVALKILPKEFAVDVDRVARFEREARAVAALSHPGIAVLYEIGEVDDTRYLAMEFVEGRNLAEHLVTQALCEQDLVDYTKQIAEALHHAHTRGVLQRDIKPANIIVTPEGRLKLLDFGLARLVEAKDETRSALTAAGTWMGTLQYCAPEVLQGRDADQRSDIYSLGMVIYQMACGKLPFEGLRGHALVSAILSGNPKPVKAINPLIGADFEYFIMRLIAADPARRPQTVFELSNALGDVAGGTRAALVLPPAGPTLAVLDFRNVTDERDSDWLGSGMAETLTADLKRLKLVTVVSRERVQEAIRRHGLSDGSSQLVQVGKELGVHWLVLGSYQRVGARLRILPRALDVSTGEEFATPKIDGAWEDVFALQDRVVADVMTALRLKIDNSGLQRIAPPETFHLEAYEQYAQGRRRLNEFGKESLELGRRHLEDAVALDPNYALAFAALGATHAMRYIHRTDPVDLDHAVRYCERAVQLDPELGEPYTWLTYAYMRQGKIEQAIRTGHKGVQRQPDFVLAHYFLGTAYVVATEHDQSAYHAAARHFVDAGFADGKWAPSWLCLGQISLLCGEYDHADRFLRTCLEIERRGPGWGYFIGSELLLAAVALRRGDNSEALRLYSDSFSSLQSIDHVYREAFQALTACGLGNVLLREGHIDSALAEFHRASRLVKEYPRMLGRQRIHACAVIGMGAVRAHQGQIPGSMEFLRDAENSIVMIATSPQTWLWGGSLAQLYYDLAVAYARLAEADLALQSLENAVASGWRDARWITSDPGLQSLHAEFRYQALQGKVTSLPQVNFHSRAALGA
jgi:serine/threonine protein kinase/tetratricopeptide (TPR) repeat protein